MLPPRANYGITRIDQEANRTHGYYVRLRSGDRAVEKFFADRACGGKGLALAKARAYRDEVLASFPEERRRSASRRKRHVPQSGVAGVTHVVARDAAGRPRYAAWQAAWKDRDGRRRTAKFSIARHGNRKALQMAKERLAAETDRS